MNPKLTLTLSLIAGLIGGALTHFVWPTSVHAEDEAPSSITVAQNLRLPVFLTNENGAVVATFTIDSDGQPNIKLLDAKSSPPENGGEFNAPRTIWSARSVTDLAKR